MDIVISCHVSFSKCHFAHFEIADYSFLGLYFWHAFIIFKYIFLLLILSFSTINSEWTWLWIILAAHFCMNLFSPELLVGGKVQNSFSHFSEFLLLLFLFVLGSVQKSDSWLPEFSWCFPPPTSFFKFSFIFSFGYAEPLLLQGLVSSCSEQKILTGCGAQVSHCCGFSCFEVRTLRHMGPVTAAPGLSSTVQ